MLTPVYKRMLNDSKCLITESAVAAAVVLHHQVLEIEIQDKETLKKQDFKTQDLILTLTHKP